MMADLQEVDLRQEATFEQQGLDRCFGVARQQSREAAVADHHHDRAVVDVAFRERGGCVGLRGIQDLDRGRRIEEEPLARPCLQDTRRGLQCGIGHEMVVSGVLEPDACMEQRSDPEAGQHVDQAGNVVLMGMAQHQQVDPAREERQPGAEATQRQLRVRAAVDEHDGAARRLDQDRVALADVERRDVQVAVGP